MQYENFGESIYCSISDDVLALLVLYVFTAVTPRILRGLFIVITPEREYVIIS